MTTESNNCPECDREPDATERLGEGHPKTETVVETYPGEYSRGDYEVVLDARTGLVVREPVRHECRRGHEWIGEDRRSVASQYRERFEEQDREWPPSPDRNGPEVYGDTPEAFDYDAHLSDARSEYTARVTDRTNEAVEAGRIHRVYDDATYTFTVEFDCECAASEALARFREAGYYADLKRDERYSADVDPETVVVVPTDDATPIGEREETVTICCLTNHEVPVTGLDPELDDEQLVEQAVDAAKPSDFIQRPASSPEQLANSLRQELSETTESQQEADK